ncbi:bifunctional (p)ppGpp synthetase/guanosine-3',5'-bis(diphosphate) 3'-pyrophosphohydrolase [Fusibacter paucivorans]|uniref:GTP diphosphokinase n=1 Tax=Fusibacter paucivorans TaxID=76009 RepID=A0ABS5PTM3_9FIRM|nr:bifunctional (p)ppGpp synthetase/guanosine-3',5'-bis(diphosphate) 3'-pyrophosphohydrolase [Fusibacter paucivorans]MBS7527734.1 bifunctional (p)ppGpp synthetase/guanosine-3',5'-bis(diphosphate) 3'-pyrophosphohydrolase [Fusibacter paucivorans]
MNLESYLAKVSKIAPYVDLDRLAQAYNFGEKAHEGQYRKDGVTPFFSHPKNVSLILAELEMDEDTIIASLLHDTVEDTTVTLDDVRKKFGSEVALLVDGVTKLAVINYETKQERQVENLRKMFLAMSSDIRVILIKLADRLHNIRTLDNMPPEKQREKAEETIEIYAPIAHRLGIFKIKWELEDMSLKYLDPEGYRDLVRKVDRKRTERESIINHYIQQIENALDDLHMNFEIYGRPKNFYSIYKKMKFQHKEFDEIYDLTAIRIICDDIKDCYSALGAVHTLWKPIPGRFKDYIAMPKPNLYQSLHTTVMGNGELFEIQIRTKDMHRIAEIGIAAHWKYKEGSKATNAEMEKKISWFRQMMEWQSDLKDPNEFMKSLKFDLFNTEVFVFTPNGQVIDLPVGSTPVDFAYKIHSEVGNKCVGAKVNGRIVPINYQLQNGQRVEILTAKNANGPSRDWLKFVKSTQAKQRIKQWFKKERREENIEKGIEILQSELRKQGIPVKQVLHEDYLNEILRRLSMKSLDDLYNALGYGGILSNQVVPKVKEKYLKEQKEEHAKQKLEEKIEEPPHTQKKQTNKRSDTGIVVKGIDDILVRFAKCCSPVPGDKIIGYITRGRGVTIHRADCPNFEKTEEAKNRFIEVEWVSDKASSYMTNVQVIASDRKGLLSEITIIVSDLNMMVTGLNAKIDKKGIAIINLSIEISDIEELNRLIRKIKGIEDVIEVKRVTA